VIAHPGSRPPRCAPAPLCRPQCKPSPPAPQPFLSHSSPFDAATLPISRLPRCLFTPQVLQKVCYILCIRLTKILTIIQGSSTSGPDLDSILARSPSLGSSKEIVCNDGIDFVYSTHCASTLTVSLFHRSLPVGLRSGTVCAPLQWDRYRISWSLRLNGPAYSTVYLLSIPMIYMTGLRTDPWSCERVR
jgi:hypothetical protein